MCGIVGLINCGNEEMLKRMLKIINHRGPDDWGTKWFDKYNSGLGNVRLAIIDLSPAGHQPMANDKGNLWITFNGEIYNYVQLKNELMKFGYKFRSNTDTEVILYAYEKWGEKCLEKFNGMFAFAIFDTDKGELFAARDRIGIKPFYYHNDRGYLIFASEIKAILESDIYKKEFDYLALINPSRYLVSPITGFKEIYKLPPGHFFKFKDGKLEIKKYWEIEPKENKINEREAIEKLDHLLNEALKLQTIADVPIGIFLSGGLDSSIVGALARRNTSKKIYSFTIKFSEIDQRFEKMSNDSLYAKIVADKFGFQHYEIEINPNIIELLPKIIWHLDEPLADPAAINTYLISRYARDLGVYVLLNGMGGDEIFGGYRKYLACLIAQYYKKLIPDMFKRAIGYTINQLPVATKNSGIRLTRWAKRFLTFANLDEYERYLVSDLSMDASLFANVYGKSYVDYYNTPYYLSGFENFSKNNISYLTKMCLNDTKVFLPEHNLTYSDKASMAASVESRPPLTDHNIVEFMFSLHPKYRIKSGVQKYLLKKVSERYLPKEIIYRPKSPFGAPLRSWIKGPLKQMIDDYLLSESSLTKEIYNPMFLQKLIMEDRAGKADNALLIWQFLVTEIWLRTFK
jgi:asparagine synthase (glutamine-hydrolysing)